MIHRGTLERPSSRRRLAFGLRLDIDCSHRRAQRRKFQYDAFVFLRRATPILGPRPHRKHCVAFRRHAVGEQKTTPKTGPLHEQVVDQHLNTNLLSGRPRKQADQNLRHGGTMLDGRDGNRLVLLGGRLHRTKHESRPWYCLGDPLYPSGMTDHTRQSKEGRKTDSITVFIKNRTESLLRPSCKC